MSWVTKTPGVCGGRACVAGTRIPVWVLHRYRTLGLSPDELLAAYPTLTRPQLTSALEYASAHQDEVAQDCCDNDEDTKEAG